MRRSVAVLALVALSWSQAMALRCELGGMAHDAPMTVSHEATAHAHGGQGSGAMEPGANAHGHASSRSGRDCRLVMACALAMLDAATVELADRVATLVPGDPPAAPVAPSATSLDSDPPPPRYVV